VNIGEAAPAFSLRGIDGVTHALADYGGADLLVLVQSCNHCPNVQAWEGRMISIQDDYAGRGVRLVALSSNDARGYPEDSFPEMRARAARQGYTFDYLHDDEQELARALGSERTPEVFVFDRDRRLRYHGAIDDSRDVASVETHYLRDALDALLSGGEPPLAETAPVGCSVKYRRQA
jgi:peroxiredoxin